MKEYHILVQNHCKSKFPAVNCSSASPIHQRIHWSEIIYIASTLQTHDCAGPDLVESETGNSLIKNWTKYSPWHSTLHHNPFPLLQIDLEISRHRNHCCSTEGNSIENFFGIVHDLLWTHVLSPTNSLKRGRRDSACPNRRCPRVVGSFSNSKYFPYFSMNSFFSRLFNVLCK